jgi:hypothetical protein
MDKICENPKYGGVCVPVRKADRTGVYHATKLFVKESFLTIVDTDEKCPI